MSSGRATKRESARVVSARKASAERTNTSRIYASRATPPTPPGRSRSASPRLDEGR
jgi:hypothetical protein